MASEVSTWMNCLLLREESIWPSLLRFPFLSIRPLSALLMPINHGSVEYMDRTV